MNHSFIALAFQPTADFPTWVIIAVVLVLLFSVVVVIAIGLTIFFVMRKRSKARAAAAASAVQMSSEPSPGESIPAYSEEPAAPVAEAAVAVDAPPPVFESEMPMEEINAVVGETSASAFVDSSLMEFDPSRTVAITRENTVAISYGYISFVSGVLAGQQFEIQPEGAYIGREGSLAQIVVADPRISKRHLWIGVKDGQVTIADQDSRNGTFVNDPRSERVTEATLNDGDTVILGESDVARFEYHS